jgi:hypothetical protein
VKRSTRIAIFLVVGAILVFDACAGGNIITIGIHVFTGWFPFMSRIPARMQWRWEVLYSVAIYGTLLIIGSHYFARWLYREMRGASNDPATPGRWSWGWSFRLFALFILMFAAGTSAVAITHQTAWLATGPEPMFYRGRERSNRVKCASNLRQIGQGIELYASDHQGRYPDDIQELIVKADINPEVLICPASDHEKAIGNTIEEVAANARKVEHHSYIYLGKGLIHPAPADMVIAYERDGNHLNDGMNVLFGDFHCEWIGPDQSRRFLEKIAKAGNHPTTLPPEQYLPK